MLNIYSKESSIDILFLQRPMYVYYTFVKEIKVECNFHWMHIHMEVASFLLCICNYEVIIKIYLCTICNALSTGAITNYILHCIFIPSKAQPLLVHIHFENNLDTLMEKSILVKRFFLLLLLIVVAIR